MHLRDQGFPVNLINVGEGPQNGADRFQNRKAELFWDLRERLSNGHINGLKDELTIAQLATIRYEYTSQGKVKIESKEEARKRRVKSPDRAEALMLAFANTTPSIIEFYARELDYQTAEEKALAAGLPPPERPKHNRLIEIYNAGRRRRGLPEMRQPDDAESERERKCARFMAQHVCVMCGADLILHGILFKCSRDRYHSGVKPRPRPW